MRLVATLWTRLCPRVKPRFQMHDDDYEQLWPIFDAPGVERGMIAP